MGDDEAAVGLDRDRRVSVVVVRSRSVSPGRAGAGQRSSSGPAILASNHLSVIDSVYLPLLLGRPVTFPAKVEYFTARGPAGRAWSAYLRSTGQLTIDRDDPRSAQATLDAALALLRDGRLLGFYPRARGPPTGASTAGARGSATWPSAPVPRSSPSR